MAAQPELFDSLIDQVEAAYTAAGGRSGIPLWLTTNTRSPKNPAHNWSFKGHEFQIGILEDMAPHIVIQKAAQKGVSELMVRAVLALLMKLTGEHAIYALPSTKFASKFAASRFDPVIKASPRLMAARSRDIDSTEIKQIGSCFLHIGGAQKESQAISIPARILVRDEYSFGDPNVLATYQSRLEHNLPQDRIIFDFSTPLFPKSGISESYELGTQHVYLCFHTTCGQWVTVDSLNHIVLPGFDKSLTELVKDDLESPNVKVKEAWLRCEHCGSPISQENLADPALRAWVPHFPDREIHSYHVDPLCTATITTPPQVISSLQLYRKTPKWIQYGIGQPYESADSQIIESAKSRAFIINPVLPTTSAGVYGAVAGMDVGKVSHLVNGAMVDGKLQIFNMETVRQGGENETGQRFVDRFNAYRSVRGVIDSEPDVSIVKYVQNRVVVNSVYGSHFVRSRGGATLDLFVADEMEGVIKANRTRSIDEFVKEFNTGKILLPKGLPFEQEVKDHLSRPKRLMDEDAMGEEVFKWVSKGADHWFFALLYCWLAAQMAEIGGMIFPLSSGARLVGKARLGESVRPKGRMP
jgi:hypothetical protein